MDGIEIGARWLGKNAIACAALRRDDGFVGMQMFAPRSGYQNEPGIAVDGAVVDCESL